METRFQTSFIPKKPLVTVGGSAGGVGVSTGPRKHRTTSFFMGLAVVAFVVSLAAVGGAYAWKSILQSSQVDYKVQLAKREEQFNIDLIEQLKAANIKIDLASQILANHVAASQIFDIISRFTIDNVRFLSLDFLGQSGTSNDIKIAMKGFGTNYSAVAFQSDVLSQLERYGLRKVVKNPILSDPALDANGTVSFGFSATIDPASISYEKSLTPSSSATSTGTSSQP